MNEKILFVGGPLDGLRKTSPHCGGQIRVFTSGNVAIRDLATSLDTTTYDVERLQENGKILEIAVWSEDGGRPLEKLIKGYRYHRKKRMRRTLKLAWPPASVNAATAYYQQL